jgi:hypothetical protein
MKCNSLEPEASRNTEVAVADKKPHWVVALLLVNYIPPAAAVALARIRKAYPMPGVVSRDAISIRRPGELVPAALVGIVGLVAVHTGLKLEVAEDH